MNPLDALNELRFEGLTEEYRNKCCNTIETALKEVSGEDRAFLKHIKSGKLHPLTTKCYQTLLDKEKAFEIIKKKSVNVDFLQYCSSVEAYNAYMIRHAWTRNNKNLTQEEYDLLKEVLL